LETIETRVDAEPYNRRIAFIDGPPKKIESLIDIPESKVDIRSVPCAQLDIAGCRLRLKRFETLVSLAAMTSQDL